MTREGTEIRGCSLANPPAFPFLESGSFQRLLADRRGQEGVRMDG